MAFWKKKKEEEAVETPVEEQKLDVDPQSVVPESLSELVIRAIREGVLIVDENKNIVLANPAAEELTGRTFDEMSGINYDSILNFLDKSQRPSPTVLIMKYAISIYNPPRDARRQFQ